MAKPTISSRGLDQLILEEGEVLRAYKDAGGVWTIGVGLTAASGVIKPKAGMMITKEKSRALLDVVLHHYETDVAAAMPGAAQHEFDAGVSFHFNTGAIRKASWVGAWRGKEAKADIRAKLLQWNKAGGKVLAGLTARRNREADMLLNGVYSLVGKKAPLPYEPAVLRRGDSGDRVEALQRNLVVLGARLVVDGHFGAQTDAAVRAFQTKHPDLTVDGIVGPATTAQIQRALDATKKLGGAVTGTAGAGAVVGGDAAAGNVLDHATGIPWGWLLAAVLAVGVVSLALIAWRYRTEIRLRIQKVFP